MAYLDEVYGNYSEWINYYENEHPYYHKRNIGDDVNLETIYNCMEKTYGKEVFELFYPWLEKNDERLSKTPGEDEFWAYDLSRLKYSYIYPNFYTGGSIIKLTTYKLFVYDNLYIGIEPLRYYLQEYKKQNVNKLTLKLSSEVMVELYDFEDNLIERKIDDEFSLIDVCYIKLDGVGVLGLEKGNSVVVTY